MENIKHCDIRNSIVLMGKEFCSSIKDLEITKETVIDLEVPKSLNEDKKNNTYSAFLYCFILMALCTFGDVAKSLTTAKAVKNTQVISQTLNVCTSVLFLLSGFLYVVITGGKKGFLQCFSKDLILRNIPVAFFFASSQAFVTLQYKFINSGTAKVVAQSKLPMMALGTVLLKGKKLSIQHWFTLLLISLALTLFIVLQLNNSANLESDKFIIGIIVALLGGGLSVGGTLISEKIMKEYRNKLPFAAQRLQTEYSVLSFNIFLLFCGLPFLGGLVDNHYGVHNGSLKLENDIGTYRGKFQCINIEDNKTLQDEQKLLNYINNSNKNPFEKVIKFSSKDELDKHIAVTGEGTDSLGIWGVYKCQETLPERFIYDSYPSNISKEIVEKSGEKKYCSIDNKLCFLHVKEPRRWVLYNNIWEEIIEEDIDELHNFETDKEQGILGRTKSSEWYRFKVCNSKTTEGNDKKIMILKGKIAPNLPMKANKIVLSNDIIDKLKNITKSKEEKLNDVLKKTDKDDNLNIKDSKLYNYINELNNEYIISNYDNGFFIGFTGMIFIALLANLLSNWISGFLVMELDGIWKILSSCLSTILTFFIGDYIMEGVAKYQTTQMIATSVLSAFIAIIGIFLYSIIDTNNKVKVKEETKNYTDYTDDFFEKDYNKVKSQLILEKN